MAGTLVAEALAHGDLGLAVAMLAPGSVATALSLWGTRGAAADLPAGVHRRRRAGRGPRALNEPAVLFDVLSPSTTARRDGDDLVLDGVKSLVPRGADAELFVVGALLDDAPVLVLVESGSRRPRRGRRAGHGRSRRVAGPADSRRGPGSGLGRARRDRRVDVRRVRAPLAAGVVRAGRRDGPGGPRLRHAVRQGAAGVRRADRAPAVGGVHGRRHRDRAAGDAAPHLPRRLARRPRRGRRPRRRAGPPALCEQGHDGSGSTASSSSVATASSRSTRWSGGTATSGPSASWKAGCWSDAHQPRDPEEAPGAGRPGPPGRDEHAAADLAQVRPRGARLSRRARHARRDDRRPRRGGSGRGRRGRRRTTRRGRRRRRARCATGPTSRPCCRSPRCAGATPVCCSRCPGRASATPPSPRWPTRSRRRGSRGSGRRWRSPSRESGSDSANISTTARLDGDDYVLDGEKIYVTSGERADAVVVWATLDKTLGRAAIKSFVVPKGTPGMTVERLEHKLGIRASDTATIRFDGCRVPAANLLGSPDVDVRQGFAGAMATFDNTRPLVAAMAVGCARASLDLTRDLLAERRGGGRLRPAGAEPVGGRCEVPAAGGRPRGGPAADHAGSLARRQRAAQLAGGVDGQGQGRAGSAPTSRCRASSCARRSATPSPSSSRSGPGTRRSSTSSRAPSRSSSSSSPGACWG